MLKVSWGQVAAAAAFSLEHVHVSRYPVATSVVVLNAFLNPTQGGQFFYLCLLECIHLVHRLALQGVVRFDGLTIATQL